MKRIALFSVLVLCVCFFAWCDKNKDTKTWDLSNNTTVVSDQTDKTVNDGETNVTKAWDLLALYKKSGKMTCEMETADLMMWTITATMYIDGDKSYVESNFTLDGKAGKVYALTVDGKSYSRGDMFGEWVWFVVNAEDDIESQLADYDEDSMDEDVKINCKSGVKGVSFEVPSDIEFDDLSAWQ